MKQENRGNTDFQLDVDDSRYIGVVEQYWFSIISNKACFASRQRWPLGSIRINRGLKGKITLGISLTLNVTAEWSTEKLRAYYAN